MQDPTAHIEKLEAVFKEFQESTPYGRMQVLPKIQRICQEARGLSDETYLWECCVRLVETCKLLARPVQPPGYEEQNDSAHALGQANLIGERLQLAFTLSKQQD